MAGRTLKLNLRFSEKDTDLLWAINQYPINDLVILAVRRHLGQTKRTIPLPKRTPITTYWKTATIYENTDPEVYAFIKRIPNGQYNLVIKLLMRHAMERCDLRYFLGGDMDGAEGRKTKRGRKPHSKVDTATLVSKTVENGAKNRVREDAGNDRMVDTPARDRIASAETERTAVHTPPTRQEVRIPPSAPQAAPKDNKETDSIFDFI